MADFWAYSELILKPISGDVLGKLAWKETATTSISTTNLSRPTRTRPNYDRMMERAERRNRAANPTVKKGKAAWSKLEDVLAEKRLLKQLQDFDEDG